MPRKGPKKVTRRDDRDLERRAERCKIQSATTRAKNAEKVMFTYKTQSNPNIPASKGERRALREALSAEGISMERWNSGNFEECFFHIARERYVNNKYPDVYSTEDEDPQWGSDSWLQMYLHVPEDYREKVSKAVEPIHPTTPEKATTPCATKPLSTKISRSQAKAMAEGVASVPVVANTEDGTTATSVVLSMTAPAVPAGRVKILNRHQEVLCANATGQLQWRNQSDADPLNDSIWTVEPIKPGKYNLHTAHDRFLSHCMWSGAVADRVSASWWEEWEISVAEGENPTSVEEVYYKFKSWRGVYLGKSGDKVVLSDRPDEVNQFVIIAVS